MLKKIGKFIDHFVWLSKILCNFIFVKFNFHLKLKACSVSNNWRWLILSKVVKFVQLLGLKEIYQRVN